MYKKNKCVYGFFLLLLILPLFFSCDNLAGLDPENFMFAISPKETYLQRGASLQFALTGAAGGVDWSVNGAHSPGTTITSDGLLFIALNESAPDLIVRAVSKTDSSKKAIAAVWVRSVSKMPSVSNMQIAGPDEIQKGESGIFTAKLTGANLVEKDQSVTWSIATQNISAGTSINSGGLLVVAADETNSPLIIRAASNYFSETGEKAVSVYNPGVAKLPQVVKPSLSDAGAGSWTAVSGAQRYRLQLYKDGSKLNEDSSSNNTSYDFFPMIQTGGTGGYTFTVTAMGNGISSRDGPESVASDAVTFNQRNPVTTMWWDDGNADKAQWVNPDSEGGYTIQLYKDGSKVGSAISTIRETHPNGQHPTETLTGYDFANLKKQNGVGEYTFKVVAKAVGNLVDSPESAHSPISGWSPFGNSKVWTIASGGGKYVAGSDDGKIAYSTDGKAWTAVTVFNGTNKAVRGIAHNGSIFVVVGYAGQIASSTDGETWTSRTSNVSTSLLTVVYGNGMFLAGGDGGQVRQSSDGITWNTITGWNNSSAILDGETIIALTYNGTEFAAFGESPGRVSKSTDGTKDWMWGGASLDNQTTARKLKGAAAGNGKYVVALENNTYLPYTATLVDASGQNDSKTAWTWNEHGVGAGIQGVAFTNGKFIAFGGGGIIAASVSGESANGKWTAKNLYPDATKAYHKDYKTNTAVCGMGGNKLLVAGPGKFAIINE